MANELHALHTTPTDTGPGCKFARDGTAQPFPGNTILCHLRQSDGALEAMRRVIDRLRAKTGDAAITWLPRSSYHVTLFDGSLDARRSKADWPAGLPLDASLETCHVTVAQRLRNFDLGFDPPIRLVVDEDVTAPTLTSIPLRPIDVQENRRLQELRDRLSVALGLRHANHDSYNFHTTFGYYTRPFVASAMSAYRHDLLAAVRQLQHEWPVIELGAPEFCLFDDMTAFQTQFTLERRP